MEFSHTSVLLNECIENLKCSDGKIMVDATLGGGGHSIEILKRIQPTGLLIGLDKDKEAINAASERLKQFGDGFKAVHSDYVHLEQVLSDLGIKGIDGCLMDLGVSSYQLDNGGRGFSYHEEAPLDMRMDRSQELNAEQVVNDYSKDELSRIIRDYGEERFASRIAANIVKSRSIKRIETTLELVEIIKQAIPASKRRTGPHPARRTFQALRIYVNGELEHLEPAITSACNSLGPGGRLCVITFHSLEDRIVKTTFARWANPCTCPKDFPQCICGKEPEGKVITRKPIIASEDELEKNIRARSAKLRVFEKKQQF